MRRKERMMSDEDTLNTIQNSLYATVAMIDKSGLPYAVPVNAVWSDGHVFFHSANKGYKTDCLLEHPQVCVVFVDCVKIDREKLTAYYKSAVVKGRAFKITDEDEKIKALKKICEHYNAYNQAIFDNSLSWLDKTDVWKIKAIEISGKYNVPDTEK